MKQNRLEAPLTILGVLLFVFFFPRLLLRGLGESSPWTPYFYLYGLGLATFLIGLRVILRARACQFGRGRDTFWFGVLLAGFVLVAALHAVWILAALYLPFRGGA